MARFFTSDTHFGHEAVIKYCYRPFTDPVAMDKALIEKWNSTVKADDVIYHLGDVSFRGAIATAEILKQLNGIKILVRGNHDHRATKMQRLGFDFCFEALGIHIDKHKVLMSHYPYRNKYNDKHRDGSVRDFSDRDLVDGGLWLLHGHVHDVWKQKDKMINVGVDQWNYKPVSEEQILEILTK